MNLLALLGLMMLLVSPAWAQNDTETAPYVYYYSNVLKGLVIERADGTDSRVLGRGMVDEDVLFTNGPGWSADGTWFAWHVQVESPPLTSTIAKGYAISINGQTLPLLADLPCVHQMYWHPSENILLVYGTLAEPTPCMGNQFPPVDTYWLLDVDNQDLLAMFSFGPTGETVWRPAIYWDVADNLLQFFVSFDPPSSAEYNPYPYIVTMFFDGRVHMDPILIDERDEYLSGSPSLADPQREFQPWLEYPEESIELIPPSIDYDGPAWITQRNPSHDWVLAGHQFCRSGCSNFIEEVSIFNAITGDNREISDCSGHPSCVGWLPERVDVSQLPPGRDISVLPAPVSIDYSDNPTYSGQFIDNQTHLITCDTDTGQMNLVINVETDVVDYVLPTAERCGTPIQRDPEVIYETQPIIFALNDNETYFAITDETEYTSLFDAQTGEKIVTLNFYGERLSFSDDGDFLVTSSNSVTATWDIQALIDNHSETEETQ